MIDIIFMTLIGFQRVINIFNRFFNIDFLLISRYYSIFSQKIQIAVIESQTF